MLLDCMQFVQTTVYAAYSEHVQASWQSTARDKATSDSVRYSWIQCHQQRTIVTTGQHATPGDIRVHDPMFMPHAHLAHRLTSSLEVCRYPGDISDMPHLSRNNVNPCLIAVWPRMMMTGMLHCLTSTLQSPCSSSRVTHSHSCPSPLQGR